MMALLQQPVFLLLAGTFGLGVFLLIAGPALGASRPDLVTRLHRLDPDVWWEEPEAATSTGVFLRPLKDDAVRLAGRVLGSVGLISPQELARALVQADSSMTVPEFYFEKVLTALGLEAVLLIANVGFERLGLSHVGMWPLVLWLEVGVFGFVWPDLDIQRRARARQTRLRAGLPTLVDLLAGAISTGRGVEDAIVDVTPFLGGPLAREWARVQQQLVRGLPVALQELAARHGLPELDSLVGHLIAGYQRGQALEDNLNQLSDTLRERRLHEVTAAGGRATGRMFLPLVFLFILPQLVLVIAPAAASLTGLINA